MGLSEPPSGSSRLPPLRDVAADAEFAEHIASAGGLVSAQRYEEAETEVLRALARVPEDLRALNLLALVRFKVGRLDEARATYREIAARAPNDPAVRRNLGLLALKAERADEAVAELELAAHLAPDDKRSWSYLGYAYTRFGDAVAAAAAFRRAGQDAVADELEAAQPPTVIADAAEAPAPPSDAPAPEVSEAPPEVAPPPRARTRTAPGSHVSSVSNVSPISSISSWNDAVARRSAETRAVPMVSFVMSSLGLAPGNGLAAMVKAGAPIKLSVRDGAHVRLDAAMASVGASEGERAVRRVRGRPSGEWLGTALRPFFRLTGPGAEVSIAAAPSATAGRR